MASVVDCPSCGRKLRLPEESLGKQVQCPTCAASFVAAGGPAEGPAPPEFGTPLGLQALDEDEPPPKMMGVPPPPKPFRAVLVSTETGPEPFKRDDHLEPCPRCGENVRRGSRTCPACAADLRASARDTAPPRRDYEPHRGQMISTLGTLSLLSGVPGLCGSLAWPFLLGSVISAILGISSVVMARDDLDQMKRNVMDPDGERSTTTGQANGFIGMALGLIGIFLGGVVWVVRFLNGMP